MVVILKEQGEMEVEGINTQIYLSLSGTVMGPSDWRKNREGCPHAGRVRGDFTSQM